MEVKQYRATMYLPVNGKQKWTAIMQGEVPVSENIYENQPIVLATALFENGILVTGGVYKSATPREFNYKMFCAFDAAGNLIHEPYQPLDVSDHEDFYQNSILFNLNEDESVEYLLECREREPSLE